MTKQASLNHQTQIELGNTTVSQDKAVSVPDDLSVRHVVHNRRWRHHVFVDSVCVSSDEMKPAHHRRDPG